MRELTEVTCMWRTRPGRTGCRAVPRILAAGMGRPAPREQRPLGCVCTDRFSGVSLCLRLRVLERESYWAGLDPVPIPPDAPMAGRRGRENTSPMGARMPAMSGREVWVWIQVAAYQLCELG